MRCNANGEQYDRANRKLITNHFRLALCGFVVTGGRSKKSEKK